MEIVDRSMDARIHRSPDLFLSYSSRDKPYVSRLAEDLCLCEVDAWFDVWEIQPGASIHELIAGAMGKARFIGICLGPNYSDSRWARDELKQALAQERRYDRTSVIPLLCGNISIPSFLEDKLYIDFRDQYFRGLLRLAAMIHGVSRQRVEAAVNRVNPESIFECIQALRYCGIEPYVIAGRDHVEEIRRAGGVPHGAARIRFHPDRIMRSGKVSPMVVDLMKRLREEVWEPPSSSRSSELMSESAEDFDSMCELPPG
jgi:hypothetical protein